MSKHTNPVQKVSIFFENKKVLKLFRFSYKIAKTANSKTAITSNNTWIWRLKFGLRVQNESYFILFTHIFYFETHVSGYITVTLAVPSLSIFFIHSYKRGRRIFQTAYIIFLLYRILIHTVGNFCRNFFFLSSKRNSKNLQQNFPAV
jgi:hypothetical protein